MTGQYILSDDGKTPVPEQDLMAWAKFMEQPDARIVRQEHLPDGRFLSTVFLGLDHSFGGGEPILWESMLFAHKQAGQRLGRDEDSRRCGGTRDDAIRMHERMLEIHAPK